MFHGIHVICTILFFQNTDTYAEDEVTVSEHKKIKRRIDHGMCTKNIIEDRFRPRT